MSQEFNVRIKGKIDTQENFEASQEIYLNGELLTVKMNNGDIRFKVGDGVSKYSELPFSNENYGNLTNKPSINGITLEENKTSEDLKLIPSIILYQEDGEVIDEKIYFNLTEEQKNIIQKDNAVIILASKTEQNKIILQKTGVSNSSLFYTDGLNAKIYFFADFDKNEYYFSLEQVQSDWNQNDNTKLDYIKNRICYKEELDETIYETIEFKASSQTKLTYTLKEGDFRSVYNNINKISKIKIDDIDYSCSISFSRGYFSCSGQVTGSWNYNVGQVCNLTFSNANFITGSTYRVNFASNEPDTIYYKMDSNYINYSSSFLVENGVFESNVGRKYMNGSLESEFCGETFNNNKLFPNIASGRCSHAEGMETTASSEASHAEGEGTVASGVVSHAEGLSTIAAGKYSHSEGKYNMEDKNNLYVHIVGGGTADWKRKNIHTLDWNGNANYSGDVYVQASEVDATGGKKVATEEYVSQAMQEVPKIIMQAEQPSELSKGDFWYQII